MDCGLSPLGCGLVPWAEGAGRLGRCPLLILIGANFRTALTAALAHPEPVPSHSSLGSIGVSWGVGQASQSFGHCQRNENPSPWSPATVSAEWDQLEPAPIVGLMLPLQTDKPESCGNLQILDAWGAWGPEHPPAQQLACKGANDIEELCGSHGPLPPGLHLGAGESAEHVKQQVRQLMEVKAGLGYLPLQKVKRGDPSPIFPLIF